MVVNSVQSLSPIQFCNPMNRSRPGLPVHHEFPEFTQMSIESVIPSSHLILCHPLLLLPPIPPSIRVFSNESTLRMRWPKYLGLLHCRQSLLLLPPIPSSITVFSNESTLHLRWPKYWSFSFSMSPSKEHLGLISFKRDWLDLLAV